MTADQIDLCLTIAQALLALWGIYILSCAIFYPDHYRSHVSLGRIDRSTLNMFYPQKIKGWRLWLSGALAFGSSFVLAWHISYPLIAWMPFDWGGHNESGEWESARAQWRMIFATAGMIGLIQILSKADKAVK